jgi:hypothetical protein
MKKDNLQPSSGISKSTEKVQRLTGEQRSNKPDTNIPHPSKLKCSECKEFKAQEDFYPSKLYPNRGRSYICIDCTRTRNGEFHHKHKDEILSKWKIKRDNFTEEKKAEIAIKHKEWSKRTVQNRLLSRAKDRSRKLGLDCNLELEDIIIPKECPLLNTPFQYGSQKDKWRTYSIDRIDNSLGYIKGNIQIISYLANTMKSSASKEQLLTFANNIIRMMT